MEADLYFIDYFDLVVVLLVPSLLMLALSVWLRRRRRGRRFLFYAWLFFSGIVFTGAVCLVLSVRFVRSAWLQHFSELARPYAMITERMRHDRIQAGNPELFSDWSSPLYPLPVHFLDGAMPAQESPTMTDGAPLPVDATKKLEIPGDFRVVQYGNRCLASWKPVPGATTYRLQQGVPEKAIGNITDEPEKWFTLFSGAKTSFQFISPGPSTYYRLRAEDGTPEDDPDYLDLYELYHEGTIRSDHISYIYTARDIDASTICFIVSPPNDTNDDGMIEADEVGATIGERYPKTPALRNAFETHKESIDKHAVSDAWGKWVSVFIPLRGSDGDFDALIGIDFSASFCYAQLHRAKIGPLIFFGVILAFFFGGTILFALLQHANEKNEVFADQLMRALVDLSEANRNIGVSPAEK